MSGIKGNPVDPDIWIKLIKKYEDSQMREKERIERILNRIKELWLRSPDMRLGQLLVNLGIVEDTFSTWRIEDTTTEEILEAWQNEQTK